MPMFNTPTTKASALDLALDAGALFKVHTEPMSIGGFVPTISSGSYEGRPERVIHYRETEDGPLVLNVAHPSHPSSNYLQVVETAEALFPESTTSVQVIEDGRKMILTQDLGEEVDLGGGDTVSPHLLWTASLDSSWSTGAHGLAHRFFCTNQLPLSRCHLKVRRTLNHDLNLGNRAAILAQVMERFEVFVSSVSTLKRIPITHAGFERILAELIPAPKPDADGNVHGRTQGVYDRKVAAVRYYFGEEQDGPAGGTAWAAYNAFQSAEAHVFTQGKNEDRKKAEIVSEDRHQGLTQAAEARLLALV